MVENIYSFLASIGYTHPLHPMLTHVPMGMVIGMVVFSFAGLIWRHSNLDKTAFHCSVLALLAIFPVVGAGLLDWQYLLAGEWDPYIIIKMVLATILTILLICSLVARRKNVSSFKMLLLYLLCLACAGGLGYSGGELVYG